MSPLLLALAGLVAVATALFLRSDGRRPATGPSEAERKPTARRPRSAT